MQEQVTGNLKEAVERVNVVEKGIRQYVRASFSQTLGVKDDIHVPKEKTKPYVYNVERNPKESLVTRDNTVPKHETAESVVQKVSSDTQNNNIAWKNMTVKEKIQTITDLNNRIPNIELSNKDKAILRKLELEHEKNIQSKAVDSVSSSAVKAQESKHVHAREPEEKIKAKLPVKPKQSVGTKINVRLLCLMYLFSFNNAGVTI